MANMNNSGIFIYKNKEEIKYWKIKDFECF